MIFVVNGKLALESRQKLALISGLQVIVRENSGLDVWAYKTALDYKGWRALSAFDEIVLLNFTIMGPVNSFADMFDEMDAKDLDFWGLTVHNGADYDPWGKMPDGVIPLHLQSHFIAIRKSMVCSPEFQRYWDDMIPIESYLDSVAKHEALFTQRFANMGFAWASYVDTVDLENVLYYPLFNQPIDLIENRKCPVFKRKSFFAGTESYIYENSNLVARDLLDYLRETGRFEMRLLIPHLIRSCHLSDLADTLNLLEVLPTNASDVVNDFQTCIIARIDTAEQARVIVARIGSRLDTTLIVALKNSLDRADIRAALKDAVVTVEIVEDVGLLGLLAAARPYGLACFVDHMGDEGRFPFSSRDAKSESILSCLIDSPAYVDAVIERFSSDRYLGVLSPLPPVHGEYFGSLGNEWGDAFKSVRTHLSELDLNVPLDEAIPPVARALGSFWFRPTSLSPWLKKWKSVDKFFDDVSCGDLAAKEDATRLTLPFMAQAAGYYSSQLAPVSTVRNQLTNMTYYLREINKTARSRRGDNFSQLLAKVRQEDVDLTFAAYFNYGNGYSQIQSVQGTYESGAARGSSRYANIQVPPGTISVRFDPVENGITLSEGVRIEPSSTLKIAPINGAIAGTQDIFLTIDGQYEITGCFDDIASIRICLDSISVFIPTDDDVDRVGNDLDRLRLRLGSDWSQLALERDRANSALEEIRATRSWRYTQFLRNLLSLTRRG